LFVYATDNHFIATEKTLSPLLNPFIATDNH